MLDVDGNKIVLEKGAGSDGKFDVGETITGGTSKATATVLVDDLGNTAIQDSLLHHNKNL